MQRGKRDAMTHGCCVYHSRLTLALRGRAVFAPTAQGLNGIGDAALPIFKLGHYRLIPSFPRRERFEFIMFAGLAQFVPAVQRQVWTWRRPSCSNGLSSVAF